MGTQGQRWIDAVRRGLTWGGVGVFLAMVGMVEAFAERQVVVGVISVGMTLVALTGVAAGYQAAQRPGGKGVTSALLRGAVAGTMGGAVVAGLVVIGSVLNLRNMFVSASPKLFSLLSFGQGLPGWYLPLLAGSGLGVIGAAARMLTGPARRPILTALTGVLTVGVFQELLQIMLGGEGIGGVIRVSLFESDGLSPRAALILFLVTWLTSAVWARRRAAARQWFTGRTASQQRGLRLTALGVGVLMLLLLPHLAGAFLSQVLVLVGLFALLGLGLNIVVGFAGLLDLGYVAFFAIGAYTLGLLTSMGEHGIFHLSFWTAVPIAMVVSMIGGVLLGIPVLGIRGDYLAIATMGFGEIIRLLVLSDFLRPWLGGSQGILAIPKPTIFGVELSGPEQLFYLTLVLCALVMFVAWRLRDSRLGRAWMAVREDEDVAEAMGINLVNVKLLAFGLGAAFSGLSGAIFAVMVGSVFPHSFQLLISINVLSLIIVGGMGSLPGVVVGSLALVGLPELLREFADFRFLVYGAALVAMMQLRPEGLWPEPVRRRELHVDEREEMEPEGVLADARERAGG
jgi:branched-chain amino acid transport system permease protein